MITIVESTEEENALFKQEAISLKSSKLFGDVCENDAPDCLAKFFSQFQSKFTIRNNDTIVGGMFVQDLSDLPKIGGISLFIFSEFRKKGFGELAANKMAEFLIEKCYDKVIIEFDENDYQIHKYCKKNDWIFEGRLLNERFIGGEFINTIRFCKVRLK